MKKDVSTIVSSRVTFVYKYIIPFIVVIFMVIICYFRWPHLVGTAKFLFPAMVWGLGLLAVTPLTLLQEVYFTDDFVVVSGLFGSNQFSQHQVSKIDKLLVLYMITIKVGESYKRIIFMPHIIDFIENFGGETRGVVKWRKLLINIRKES